MPIINQAEIILFSKKLVKKIPIWVLLLFFLASALVFALNSNRYYLITQNAKTYKIDNLVAIKSQGTDIARKLQSLSIGADPKAITAKQAILAFVISLPYEPEPLVN